jgi:hypothetical protein
MFAIVTHVFLSFLLLFVSISDVCYKCFSYFGRMLYLFHLDVVKVDRMLHMLQCA